MFELRTEEARLLLNIALMAVGRARFQSAAQLLAVLEQFRPDQPSVAEAKAIALLSAGQFPMTIAYIDKEASVKFPQDAMLKAFKGMALRHLGRLEEAQEVLREAAFQEENPAAANLAKELLNE